MRRHTAFAHLCAGKPLDRTILEAFTEAKTHFVLHLRRGEALEAIARRQERDRPSAAPPDGSLRITLEPALDGEGSIETSLGRLRGADCFVTIESVFGDPDLDGDADSGVGPAARATGSGTSAEFSPAGAPERSAG